MFALINLFVGGYLWFIWPALGVLGIALAIQLLNILLGEDQERPARALSKARRQIQTSHGAKQADPNAPVASPTTQVYLNRSRAYGEQIRSLIKSTSDQKARARLQTLAAQVGEWTQAIEDLVKRIDRFQQDRLIRQDLQSVPQAIETLERRLAQETNEATRIELQRTLAHHEHQLATLERLQSMMNRAEIKVESTLSALGTIYSQILTVQSTNQVADYNRLSAEVDEEVHTLQDHLEALEEVKLGSSF